MEIKEHICSPSCRCWHEISLIVIKRRSKHPKMRYLTSKLDGKSSLFSASRDRKSKLPFTYSWEAGFWRYDSIHANWIILANYRWSKIEHANALTRDTLKNQRVAGDVLLVLPWGLFALFLIYVLFGGLYFSPCVTADWVSAECERSVWIPASLAVSNSVWLAVWARDQGTYMRSERRDFFYRILEKKAQHYSNAINSKLQGK